MVYKSSSGNHHSGPSSNQDQVIIMFFQKNVGLQGMWIVQSSTWGLRWWRNAYWRWLIRGGIGFLSKCLKQCVQKVEPSFL